MSRGFRAVFQKIAKKYYMNPIPSTSASKQAKGIKAQCSGDENDWGYHETELEVLQGVDVQSSLSQQNQPEHR